MSRAGCLLAVVVLVLGGCGSAGSSGPAATGAGTAGSAAPVCPALGALAGGLGMLPCIAVGGLHAAGAGPTLSWSGVTGATSYGVTATTSAGPAWAWNGPDTHAVFGSSDASSLYPDLIPVASPQPGTTYTWYVMAFDAAGRLIGVSASATFTCAASCTEGSSPQP
jgi:hypothetical protein